MQLRRRPWITLLACIAASGEVTGQTGAAGDPADAASQSSAAAEPAQPAASGTGLNWRGAPVATTGSVSYDLRASHAAGEPRLLSQLVTSSLSASTYIYQPWFATAGGTLGVTMGRSRGGIDENASAERFITGNARVDLFPRSRFPFEVHVESTDSRIDSGLASSLDFRTRNFGFSQRYRPESGAYNVSASFDRRAQTGSGARDTQDVLAGDFSTRWKSNELSLGLSQSQARRADSDQRSQFRSMVGRHQYAPASALSISTTVNLSQTDEEGAAGASELSVLQWSSVGVWHPAGSKLAMSGSVRGLLLREGSGRHALDSLGLNLGATYELNPNTRLTASGSASTTSSDGTPVQAIAGSVGASWQGDTAQFMGLRYDPYANGSFGASHAGNDSQTTTAGQLGHTLSRSWPIASQSSLALNAGQTLTLARNSSSNSEPSDFPTSVKTILHSVGATWSSGGDNRTAYARATYNDSREIGGSHSRFQLFNFQLSGSFAFDRNRSLSGDLTLQRAQQRAGDQRLTAGLAPLAGERTGAATASGEIVYRHLRPFGVARLRFTSQLKLAQDVLNQPGAFVRIPDRETRSWENRLDWLVGRLETQLVLRVSQVDGKRREFLMWRVQRSFGG